MVQLLAGALFVTAYLKGKRDHDQRKWEKQTPFQKSFFHKQEKSEPESLWFECKAQIRFGTSVGSRGALRGIARRNQLPPWTWDDLTPVDLTEIADLLWDLPSSASDAENEAAFAIAAILTTGRKLISLETLSIFDTENELKRAAVSEGLIRNGGKPYWRLIAGSPGRQSARRPTNDGRQRYKNEITAFIPFVLAPVALHCFGRLSAYRMVGSRSGNVEAHTITPVVSERTRAVIVVHLAGFPADMDPLMSGTHQRFALLSRARGSKQSSILLH